MQVIRLKRLKERLGVVLDSRGGSISDGGGTNGDGDSSAENGRETSKSGLLIMGTVLRLSEIPKKESCGDDGGLRLLRLKVHALLSLGSGDGPGSSIAPELLRLLTSFRRSERLVENIWPTIPQYATSACSS